KTAAVRSAPGRDRAEAGVIEALGRNATGNGSEMLIAPSPAFFPACARPLHSGLDVFQVETRIGKCPRDAFAILIRRASAAGGFIPCAFDALLHGIDNAFCLVVPQQEAGSL